MTSIRPLIRTEHTGDDDTGRGLQNVRNGPERRHCHCGMAADDSGQTVNRNVVDREVQSQWWIPVDDHPHEEVIVGSDTPFRGVAGDGPVLLSDKDADSTPIRGPGQVIRAEGLDLDDPAAVTAIDFVSWELSMLSR